MSAFLPGQPVQGPSVDGDDAHISASDAPTGLPDAHVPTPSDADDDDSDADDDDYIQKRVLHAIEGALEQGPRAVVDAMCIALPRGEAYDKISGSKKFRRFSEELPISAACAMDQSLAVISKLMEAFPDHVGKKDKHGRTALYWAASCNSNAAVISKLLRAYPEAAREKSDDGSLPLHCSEFTWTFCMRQKSFAQKSFAQQQQQQQDAHDIAAVFSELLQAYPEAARERDDEGVLPLHLANFTDVEIISKLLKAYPEAAREKDRRGDLPLHVAVRETFRILRELRFPVYTRNHAAALIELLKAYPEAAREKMREELFPLQFFLDICKKFRDPSFDLFNGAVILELLKSWPEAARVKSPEGELPLQCYAYWGYIPRNVEILSEMLKGFPDALLLFDSSWSLLFSQIPSALSQTGNFPFFLMKSSMHPMYLCLKLSAELMAFSRSQSSKDIRSANDADETAAELEQLACAIARNGEDSRLFGQEMDECLHVATDLKLKFFVSEPACSYYINSEWSPYWMYSATIWMACFFWISGLNFVLNVHDSIPPPLVRFLMNRASYFAFLVCLLQLPVLPAPGHPVHNMGLEVFLAYWLFDICFSEVAEFLDIMRKYRLTAFEAVARYAEDPWNVYDVVALSTAVAAAVMRGLVHAGVGDATAAASNQLYAWALALLWGRLVNVLSVVSFIGPLLIMVFAMVFRDLSKFVFLVALMELPFVAALYFLESGDGGNEAFATFPDSALSFFKIVIGQGPDISSVTDSSSVLLSVGSLLLSVLLLNLLIAMFSKTFDTIVENSTQEYLLQRAQLKFTWARAPRMPPPLACALALRDWAMNMVARHVWHNATFRVWFAGWDTIYNPDGPDHAVERVEPPLPTFDKKHFYEIVFPKEIEKKKFDRETELEIRRNPAKREEWTAQWMQECDAKYEAWCEQVLADLEENAEFNSEAQMDKFKSRMLRGIQTTVESSGKIDQIAENAKATQEQVKALSDAVQSHATQEQVKATQEQVKALSDAVLAQHAQIQQMHASMQLILQKLNP
jgi:hypothetical protein